MENSATSNQQPLCGIDLGGTKTEGVILESRDNPRVLHRMRIPTEAGKGYEHIVNQVGKLVEMLSDESGLQPAAVGIGHPGTLDPNTGVIKNANTTALNGRPFHKDLEKRLGVPVRLANDANCFAVAEATLGGVRQRLPNAEVVFGVILGTGVGGGWVIHGKVINGRQGIGGEWGHNFLDESGGPCYCGRVGCVETVISGPALEKFYQNLTLRHLPLRDIVAAAETGDDPAATQTLDRLIHFFGKAIAVVINIMDPDAIVLGGGVGNIERLYTDGMAEAGKYLFNTRIDTVFLKPELGDSAGVFGAALL
ncbi:MAG: ROK family protein [Haliscomenobacteraceae bacterium CHB4]|nr:Fructokinase [Saprospiraceae bacterium]MCE7921463.1 ROK family protein [Haliscomenobacteraceae bacterium CHB4]